MRRRYRIHSLRAAGTSATILQMRESLSHSPGFNASSSSVRTEASHRRHRPAVRLHAPAPGGQRPDLCRPRDLERDFHKLISPRSSPSRSACCWCSLHIDKAVRMLAAIGAAGRWATRGSQRRPYQPEEFRFVHVDRGRPDLLLFVVVHVKQFQVRILLRDGQRGADRGRIALQHNLRCSATRSG